MQPPTKPVVWPRVTTEPVAKSYWVDPAKVSTRLNAREADGSIVREREPGFLISTAEAVVVGGATKPAEEGDTKWLRTKAGFHYSLEDLTTTKPKGGDVLKIGTLLIAVGDLPSIERALNVSFKGDAAFLPGVISRKKQIVPALSLLWG